MDFVRHKGLVVNKEFLHLLEKAGLDSFDALMDYSGGEMVDDRPIRTVVRLELDDGGIKRRFYLKRHYTPLKGKIKGLLSLGGTEDARNEWHKIVMLKEHGYQTMEPVAYGERAGLFETRALTLTEELYGTVRVEDYIPRLSRQGGPEGLEVKRRIIKKLALIARKFHQEGFNHQDFYLGHFLINPSSEEIFLIDLQRVQKRSRPVRRWVLKDLAQFVFSAINTEGFHGTDLVRFGHTYLGRKKFTAEDRRFIRQILKKAEWIARHTAKILARKKGKSGQGRAICL